MAAKELSGLRVLIVEDEALIALMLEDILDEVGARKAGAFGSLNEALAAADGVEADAAVLDINLGGKEVYPLAEKLAARGIPFVFSTGYGENTLPERWRGYAILTKPFDQSALMAALKTATAR